MLGSLASPPRPSKILKALGAQGERRTGLRRPPWLQRRNPRVVYGGLNNFEIISSCTPLTLFTLLRPKLCPLLRFRELQSLSSSVSSSRGTVGWMRLFVSMYILSVVSAKALHYAAAGGSAPSALFLLQRSAMAGSLGCGSQIALWIWGFGFGVFGGFTRSRGCLGLGGFEPSGFRFFVTRCFTLHSDGLQVARPMLPCLPRLMEVLGHGRKSSSRLD